MAGRHGHATSVNGMKCLLPLAIILLWLVGCKPGVPKQYIQPGKMEKILYDYHIADGMATTNGDYEDVGYRRTVYREAALRKHGVTQAEFDSSLVYYYRHTEQLHEIYVNLAKRLNNESVALGSTANEMSQLGSDVSQGDTTTVWTNPQSVTLIPYAPYNVISFDVKADSSYHEGDRMILNLDAQFIFQDGMRDGVAMLAVVFRNDSVATQVTHMSSSSHYLVQVFDNQRVGIKSVRGFVYLSRGQNNESQTLKLMCVRNMKLMKMKAKPVEENKEEDSPAATIPPGGPSPQSPSSPPPASATSAEGAPASPASGPQPVSMRPSVDGAPPPPPPDIENQAARNRYLRKREGQ